jgi:hypothetical protein
VASATPGSDAVAVVAIAVGIIQTLRYRRRTIRQLRERDPVAFAAYRRGVHLSPPT